MSVEFQDVRLGAAGAFGVNYALRPHKFVDRRVFIEVINRFASVYAVEDHVYVGLGSFGMEDHKLLHSLLGTRTLISLEIDADVVSRQRFNTPLPCIKPTHYSTEDFVLRRSVILREFGAPPEANTIIWFDMTDAQSLRVYLDMFGQLLRRSQSGDIVRMTVDIDEKTLGRRAENGTLQELARRRFSQLREWLGEELNPRANVRNLSARLGIARLVAFAFKLVAEKAFDVDRINDFVPFSITTYADGHRMLSITGAVVERSRIDECRGRMRLGNVPGGVSSWDEIVEIRIPQLTVWEKLSIDRDIGRITPARLAQKLNFRLHETISTTELLKGYDAFQRFYPTFRPVLL